MAKGATKVSTGTRAKFVMGSRPPDMYAPRIAPRAKADIVATGQRIKPLNGKTNYAKTPPSFGNTGLTGES